MLDNLPVAMALIAGVTEAIKRLGLPTKYVPLTAVTLGIIYAITLSGIDHDTVVAGIILGLTTTGLYRTVQKVVE